MHAWAKSRAGFNGVLTINRLSADGRHVLDDGQVVFDGRERHPTIEGPKFYKRNGWYYIFAPAGGVKRGWQTVLRSRNVYGPYEDRVILEHGLHQGAWVDDWFVHFQDRGAYGRVVHLQPLKWANDWPEIDPCVECGVAAAASAADSRERPSLLASACSGSGKAIEHFRCTAASCGRATRRCCRSSRRPRSRRRRAW